MSFGYDAPTKWPDEEKNEVVNITISVFFDGTMNNKNNTEARLEYNKKQEGKSCNEELASIYESKGIKQDSYENDYSNVARLFKYYEKNEQDPNNPVSCVYVEGIGTLDNRKDQMYASATGGEFFYDQRGIKAKVIEGCDRVNSLLNKLNPRKKKIKKLTIDVFGFSRGAAAARSFIHEITKSNVSEFDSVWVNEFGVNRLNVSEQPRYGRIGAFLKNEGIIIEDLRIRFAGLFDTVSSYYGMINKKNDVYQLNLEAVQQAEYILHLTAEDEHRVNFPLIKIRGDGVRKKEFSLPGVHCDLGGSYVDDEEKVTVMLEPGPVNNFSVVWKKLIENGWIKKDDENSYAKINMLNPVKNLYKRAYYHRIQDLIVSGPMYELIMYREMVSNKYSFIPLYIMCDYAMRKPVSITFTESEMKKKFKIPKENYSKLNRIKDILYDYVLNNGRKFNNLSKDYLLSLARKENDRMGQMNKKEVSPDEILYTSDNLEAVNPEANRYRFEVSLNPDFYPDNPELQQMLNDFKLLKEIRYKYLHWSANYKKTGMAPRIKSGRRIRDYFPKA